jgi:transposase
MGRLSAYAKNRILKLRFKKNKRIIHIVEVLQQEDNIKVSRQAVSTFLKKYLETSSICDKPRTGRKRKLSAEEIQLIGQVTRLNRDITARAIKEYLNLNVSTYTILRATKHFEWNKVNPNSNDSKKQASIDKQQRMEERAAAKKQRLSTQKKKPKQETGLDANNSMMNGSAAEAGYEMNTTCGEGDGLVGGVSTSSAADLSTSAVSESNELSELHDEEGDNDDGDDNDSDMMSESGEIEKIQPRQLNKINGISETSGVVTTADAVNDELSATGQESKESDKVKPKPVRITAHSIPGNISFLRPS